jgi:hypothetical protein
MPPTCHPYLRRTTTSVLVAVALVSGGILLLGDRFRVTPGFALTQRSPIAARIAACVAEENMRLVDPDQEQCQPGEVELTSPRSGLQPISAAGMPRPAGPAGPPGAAGRAGTDGVSGFEIVTAKLSVPGRETASAEARCPPGKVALGGGVLHDPADGRESEEAAERMAVTVSAPLLPGDSGGSGWVATVRNTRTGALAVVVAAVCVAIR